MTGSPAYQRFVASTVLDFDQWHDGLGYDLTALPDMTEAEREHVADMMIQRDVEWREIEVLAALDSDRSWRAIEQAFARDSAIETHLAAAEELYRHGRLPLPLDAVLADAILRLRDIPGGSTRALLMAEQHPSEKVKAALLEASGKKTEIAMHCAALLCYLTGKAKEAFDWDLRPFFLRLAPDNPDADRTAAYRELCALVAMTP